MLSCSSNTKMPSASIKPTESSPLLPQVVHPTKQQSLKAYLLILIGATAYPIVVLLVRYSETRYSFPAITALLLRAIVSTALAIVFLPGLPSETRNLTFPQLWKLLSSGVFGAAHFLLMYYALNYAPLATVVTVQSVSTPLTAFFCALILGEGVRKSEVFALAASTLGVMLIAHPGEDSFNTDTALGIALTAISAILTAFWCLLLRAMGVTVHALLRVICLSVSIGFLSSIFSKSSDWSAIVDNRVGTTVVSFASAISFGSMMAFNAGMKRCKAGPGLLVMTLSVPFSFFLGWLFLGESAGWNTLLGAGLVIGSAGAVALQAAVDDEQET